MAFQTTNGMYSFYPGMTPILPDNSMLALGPIDATGEKIAIMGRVWYEGGAASKDITRVGFRFGAVTKSGGSGLTVSLQDVSLASGPPGQPDGTQDQTVAVANGNALFAPNTWITTAALSANRTVGFGDPLSLVVEFDGAGRLGSDAVNLSCLTSSNAKHLTDNYASVFASGAWVLSSGPPNIVLGFSDGTWGTFDTAIPCSAINVHTVNSGSTPNERALAFTVPFTCQVNGLWCHILTAAAGSNFDLNLYQGTTFMTGASVDGNAFSSTAQVRCVRLPIAVQTLQPNTQYYVAAKPTTATNITVYSLDVNDANHWSLHDGGVNLHYAERSGAGAWTPTTTRRFLAGVRLSALSDGSGGHVASRVQTGM